MKITPITLDRTIMTCPVCSLSIVARVRVQPKLGEGKVTDENRVELPVSAEMVAFDISHSCPGRADDGVAS